jgi:hypothetical protein
MEKNEAMVTLSDATSHYVAINLWDSIRGIERLPAISIHDY